MCTHFSTFSNGDVLLMVVSDEVLFVSDEVLFVSDEVLFVSDEVLFVSDEVLFVSDEVLFVSDEVLYCQQRRRCFFCKTGSVYILKYCFCQLP